MPGTKVGLNAYCLRGWMNGWMDARKGVYLKLFYSLNSKNSSNLFKMEIGDIYIVIYSIREVSPVEWQLTDSHAWNFVVLKLELRINKEHSGWSLKLAREGKGRLQQRDREIRRQDVYLFPVLQM